MKVNLSKLSKVAFCLGVVGVMALAADTIAKPPRPGSGCPRTGILCLDVYQPVLCTNRAGQPQVYSNSCYAYVDCATGCVPYGGVTE